jgi:hypothetical protein
MVQKLQDIVNEYIVNRDYPFHTYAILSHPKYKYIEQHAVPYVEISTKKSTDVIIFAHHTYTDITTRRQKHKPSLTCPVFVMTIKDTCCNLKTIPVLIHNTDYRPLYDHKAQDLVYAAIEIAKDRKIPQITIEDNTIGLSDLHFLRTGHTWFKFLPIIYETPAIFEKNLEHLLYKQWSVIKGVFKDTPINTESIIMKHITPYHIGSAYRVIKRIIKNTDVSIITRYLPLILSAFEIESFYGQKYRVNVIANKLNTHPPPAIC